MDVKQPRTTLAAEFEPGKRESKVVADIKAGLYSHGVGTSTRVVKGSVDRIVSEIWTSGFPTFNDMS